MAGLVVTRRPSLADDDSGKDTVVVVTENGERIVIRALAKDGRYVRMQVVAPPTMRIVRGELERLAAS